MTVIINGTTGITNVNGSAAAPAETGTDTDTGIVYGTNTLSLVTGGTTALTIDSSQKVAFAAGVTGGLNVSGAGWGVLPYVANSTVIDNNSGQTRLFATGANTSTYGTLLSYAGTTNGSATLLTTVGKDLTFALQGATQSAGTGIAFPATQSASTDANTLDDYEEGTWTPQILGGSTNPTVTYAGGGQVGKYTKIGNIVYASANISWTGISGGSGEFVVNMPFAASGDGSRGVGSIPYNTGVTFSQYGAVVHSNIASGNCYFIKPDSSQKYSSYVNVSDVAASGVFQVVVVYKV